MAKKLDVLDHTTFTGRIDYSEAPLYLNLGNIAVSPKITLSGKGNGKIYNYMACGLPTVVFDFLTNREILRDTGIYVQEIDPELFAKAIVKLLIDDNKKIKNQLNFKARETAINNYSWGAIAQKMVEVYKWVN